MVIVETFFKLLNGRILVVLTKTVAKSDNI